MVYTPCEMDSTYINTSLPIQNLVDSHFHAVMLQERNLEPHDLLTSLMNSGFGALLDIGTETADIEVRNNIISGFPRVFMTIGLYPSNCDKDDIDTEIQIIRNYTKLDKVVGIGEIGLDYHWNYGTRELQKDLFRKQIELANESSLPVCIHTRDAEDDTVAILHETPPRAGGIIHCFSSNPEAARKYLDAGMHISFAGNVTYKSAETIRKALSFVPSDRLLFETDAPYLAPQLKRGKPNHPGYIQYIYDFAAAERKVPIETLISSVFENFNSLFKVHLQE